MSKPTGVLLMLGQQAFFVAEMTLVHQIGSSLSFGQIVFARGIGGLLLVAFLARGQMRRVWRTPQPLLQLARGLATAGYLWVFAYSFSTMPLTDATALSYSSAIYSILLAVPILGERLGGRRLAATIVGFAGALLIIKPGFRDVSLIYVLVLAGTSLNGLAFVLTKVLERRDSALTVMFWLNVITVAVFLPGAAAAPAVSFSPWVLGLLLFGPVGQYLGILALRHADASALVPITYVRLVFAGMAALLLFGERPDMASIVGATVIFVSLVLAVQRGNPPAALVQPMIPRRRLSWR